MSTEFNIEDFERLGPYLHTVGLIVDGDEPVFHRLPGGVSNRTVLVQRRKGQAFVIKQALERLRVATEWHCDPRRIEREALGLTWLERLAPPGTITPLLFLDRERHLLAMQAVSKPHTNWKTSLLEGQVALSIFRQFGQVLGTIHGQSRLQGELASVFEDRSFFEALRLEPYYRYTSKQVTTAEPFLKELIADTLAESATVVHGDYSPKNVLIHRDQLVLLDHEVIHFGDPAFDVGFSLTHFLSKAHHLPESRAALMRGALEYWTSYQRAAGDSAGAAEFQTRVIRHTLACSLARVAGRSPLEYLTGSEGRRQTDLVLRLIPARLAAVEEFISTFQKLLS